MLQHFELDEFKCPCCQKNEIKNTLVLKLDMARHYAGVPFRVNSGFRCPQHNKAVGGVPNSSHPAGWAADIAATNSVLRFKILSGLIKAGFHRIGIANTFIHADYDPIKPAGVIWIY
jgi:zinc D-Ala-D-Ala carboxypeptidase